MNRLTKEEWRRKKHIILYGILFIVLLCCHFTIDLTYGDDGYFAHVLDGVTWKDFLISRYHWASSRIVLEAVYIPLTQYAQWLWRIMDSAVIIVILWNVNAFFGTEDRVKGFFLEILLALFVPMTAIMGAGWIATTANYLWTAAAAMIALIPVKKWTEGRTLRWWEHVVCGVCLLYAANHEQTAALLLGLYAVCGLWLAAEKIRGRKEEGSAGRKIPWQYWLYLLFTLLAVRYIAECPGNYWRRQHDIEAYFPDFSELTLFRKLFLGMLTTGHYYMSAGDGNWIIPLTAGAAMAAIIAKYRKHGKRAEMLLKAGVASIPFLFSVLAGHLCSFLFHQGILHRGLYWLGLFWNDQLPEYTDYTEGAVLGEVLIFGGLFLCLLLGIWWAMDTWKEKIWFLVLSVAGAASRIILGFSPSVYASGNRTTFFATFLLLCTVFYIGMHKVLYKERRCADCSGKQPAKL